MTEHQDPHVPDRGVPAQDGRSGSLWSVFAPAAALLLGLVLGGVLVGVVVDGDDERSLGTDPSASPTPGGDSGSPSAGATVIVVPDECLAAADSVDQAVELARQGADAVRQFEPEQLRELLRELEELDLRARAQAEACREVQTSSSPAP